MIFLLFSLLFLFINLFSQQVRIEAFVAGHTTGKIYLSKIRGEEHRKIDSLFVSGEIFRFVIKDTAPGIYRITMGKSGRSNFFDEDPVFFDLIVNSENSISIKTSFLSPLDSMQILVSEENQIFYEYLKYTAGYKERGSLLLPLFSVYKEEDDFFSYLKKEFLRLQQEYNEKLVSLANTAPGTFASSYILTGMIPMIDPSAGYDGMNNFLKKHFFDLISFKDPRLINSQIYTQKILEYMSFYHNPSLSQSEQEDRFIQAVDQIMERALFNEEVFDFILGFLVDGFDRFKMEKVLVHLAAEYVEKGCETDSKKIMEQRLDAYKRMAPGNKVNDIVLPDMYGATIRLYELTSDYVLIIFWSSRCPHCIRLLPDIKEWYINERHLNLEVFTVSIDTSRFDWEENLLMNDYPWINVSNLQGWEGKATSDYNIYASPTMFLVDRNRKIIAKPTTFREFRREIDRITNAN